MDQRSVSVAMSYRDRGEGQNDPLLLLHAFPLNGKMFEPQLEDLSDGRRVIAPEINARRTWEGFFGGVATATLLGALLCGVTPFRIWEAACMATVTAVMGFAGSMTLSAIKRDRGVRDTGTLVQGHAGVLDRIDSLCFAAPVFFHLTRYFFSI